MDRRKKSSKTQPESRFQQLLGRPWIFAGAALGLDLAMLTAGIVLSKITLEPEVIISGTSISRSEPKSFFGVTAAVVLGVICVLTALIIAGAFRKKRRAVQLAGAAGLLIASLAMVGSSAYMAVGFPPETVHCYSFTDNKYQLMVVEDKYPSANSVSFYIARDGEGEKMTKRLATTALGEISESAERYAVTWVGEDQLVVSFQDGANYRSIQMTVGE